MLLRGRCGLLASAQVFTLKQVKRRWSSRNSRGRSHFSHQALLECVSPSVCVVCMLETESVSSPEASHLNSVWKWASCQSSTWGCLGKWAIHQSAARLWEGDEAVAVYSIWPGTCTMLHRERERERPGGGEDDRRGGARGEHKKMEEQHLWPSERNPGAIQKKRTNWQKGIVSAFLLSLLHLLFSVSLQIYSRCLQNHPPPRQHPSPPPLCLPAPGNCRLAEIFLFK